MDKEQLVRDLIRDEGLKLEAYHDSKGHLTIGIGRLIDPGLGGRISKSEAMFMLTNDLEAIEKELDAKLDWWRELPDQVQRALFNMTFNLGFPRLSGFKKMLAALRVEDFEEAANQALDSLWARQVGLRARRIADMIRSA